MAVATAMAATSCTSPPPEGIAFRNRTGERLDYVYLAPGVGEEQRANEHRILRLDDGDSADIKPLPLKLNCTVAPVVARTSDGREVARLPAKTCWDPLYVWQLDEDDL